MNSTNPNKENPSALSQDRRRRAERHFRIKVVINVILVLLGSAFIALFLSQMQNRTALEKQRTASGLTLESALDTLDSNKTYGDQLAESFHKGNQAVLNDMVLLLKNRRIDQIVFSSQESALEVVADLMDRSGALVLMLLSEDGKSVIDSFFVSEGANPVKEGLMTNQELKRLLKGTAAEDGTVQPVKTKLFDDDTAFYYYSIPYNYKGVNYVIVIGTDATRLDEQIDSIRDVSHVLSQENEGTNRLIFAVDRETGTFLYGQMDSEVLTGKSIQDVGLSETLLTDDDYTGTQTINGTRYYCVATVFDENTVICSAARIKDLYADSRFVLFWSVLTFVLIMVICLAYSVVVRNDFVRRAVVTEKITLFRTASNELYFDKSVFQKVFPLMVVSVMVLFGISLYVQTMLELSEAMNRSKEAVSNIPALYSENTSNRETVQEYYNDQFISKAELISFLLETDPSALNEQSDHYHFYYDKDGSKQFIYGENGQRIKSVGSSGKLEELCRGNNIESIYVFDEEGRTIGTNTSNWFFTISNKEGDQSYEFRPLLDGRTDSYVQAIKKNDLGKTAQFVGVAFHYYTKEDKDGNLVYVSRYQAKSPDVTSHRAMIQIELDAEESERLNQATDYAYLMPTFIENSFIQMYEAEGAHRCLYSPLLEQVGMTAEQLGVPKKAFNSNFYCRFEGIGSFEQIIFYQRSDDYFFETTMSHGDVFQRRTTTALTTALIAFVLILILCATVTLTSKEEEELYADSYLIPDTFSWFAGSPEQKLIRMCRLVAAILLLSVLTALYLAERNFDDHSLLRFVIGGEWDKGVHLFAFSKAALMVLMVVFAVTLIRIPLKQLPSLFGARGETVGHLLMSLVEYTGALGAVFYTMHLFGVNSTQLIASAGLLTLIIGLGSQSLIKDIISGLFIVFEGEFQVGDIVTIHGHRGIVQDIGLRTTKILGIDGEKGNLKIVNNSEITEVLNMAYAPSEVTIRISIEYGQDLEYVEAVLRRDLPALAEEYSDILTGLRYNGVGLLGESGVELVILCNCDDIYWKRARNIMNRGVLEIFYRNGINVPFPNVTVSHLDTSGRKTMKDFTDTNSADTEDSKR